MSTKLDSVTLFLAQLTNHSDELALLLAVGPSDPIDPTIMERSHLSTDMLGKSTSVMELHDFQRFLKGYRGLLTVYRDRNLPWDERIAQLTSEVIDKEDHLIQEGAGLSVADLAGVVAGEEWQALLQELEEVKRVAEQDDPDGDGGSGSGGGADSSRPGTSGHETEDAAVDTMPADSVPGDQASTDTASDAAAAGASVGELLSKHLPLGSSLDELRVQADALVEHWNNAPWDLQTLEQEDVRYVRRRLFMLSFYAQMMQQMIALKTGDPMTPRVESLAPIRYAMEDFSRALCAGSSRTIDVKFMGEHALDSRLLSPVVRVLQLMVADVFLRCEDERLKARIVVQEQNGGLFWSLQDNGTNFVSDSPLDPEEYLAFYPGLREVRRILSEYHSLLWVEPSDNKDTRFSFSTSDTPEGDRFVLWGHGHSSLAVMPSEIGDIMTPEEAAIQCDGRGEYIVQNGERVAVVRLGHVYEGAPSEGDLIVVIGYLEQRIAFYVNGESRLAPGTWVRDAVPSWKGLKGIALVDSEKIPLVEADALLRRYLELTSELSEGGIAGGDIPESDITPEPEVAQESVRPSAPEDVGDPSDTEVLVVERSEALRNTFASILARNHVRARLVNKVEDAFDCLDNSAPRLIISEFRVPSMAAKVLVERLKAEGKSIPVLVTTTHHGENADLLVEKLGVDGYISKPINQSDVLSLLDGFMSTRGAPGC
jgi:CheY-like chemotaxis protein